MQLNVHQLYIYMVWINRCLVDIFHLVYTWLEYLLIFQVHVTNLSPIGLINNITFMIFVCRSSAIVVRNIILPLFKLSNIYIYLYMCCECRGRKAVKMIEKFLYAYYYVYVCVYLFLFASSNSCLFVLFSDQLNVSTGRRRCCCQTTVNIFIWFVLLVFFYLSILNLRLSFYI